jgi:hypothetical protein
MEPRVKLKSPRFNATLPSSAISEKPTGPQMDCSRAWLEEHYIQRAKTESPES